MHLQMLEGQSMQKNCKIRALPRNKYLTLNLARSKSKTIKGISIPEPHCPRINPDKCMEETDKFIETMSSIQTYAVKQRQLKVNGLAMALHS